MGVRLPGEVPAGGPQACGTGVSLLSVTRYLAAPEPSRARCHDSGTWSAGFGVSASTAPMTTTGHRAARRQTRMTGPAARYGSGPCELRPEHQHVGVRRLVEQHARGEPLGDLGAHADAREQAQRLADRPAQHVTGGTPASARLPGRRDGIARDLMTRGFQGQHGQDLRGAQARLAARPSERGHGLRGTIDADDDTPNAGVERRDLLP